jgi:hypothetical protein
MAFFYNFLKNIMEIPKHLLYLQLRFDFLITLDQSVFNVYKHLQL